MAFKVIKVLGFHIFNDNYESVINRQHKVLINTISPNSFSLSLKNSSLKKSLNLSEVITLDGLYFGLAPKLLKGISVPKKSGTDWFYFLMDYYNQIGGCIFFLGSTNGTLAKIKSNAELKYPNLLIDYLSPPFKSKFNENDIQEMSEKINKFSPDVLFLGLTAPKQEILSYQLKDKVNAKIICSIGNVFDWFAGNQKQPEKIWVNLGLEWFIRTIRRPEILKRYPNVFYFFWILFLNIIRVRKD
jgi:N-acetylglucosaminyldiphosphoundecaprenol N-acetyl-beta-D-mannosaminyltransferase